MCGSGSVATTATATAIVREVQTGAGTDLDHHAFSPLQDLVAEIAHPRLSIEPASFE
jgi:hypothetical protein